MPQRSASRWIVSRAWRLVPTNRIRLPCEATSRQVLLGPQQTADRFADVDDVDQIAGGRKCTAASSGSNGSHDGRNGRPTLPTLSRGCVDTVQTPDSGTPAMSHECDRQSDRGRPALARKRSRPSSTIHPTRGRASKVEPCNLAASRQIVEAGCGQSLAAGQRPAESAHVSTERIGDYAPICLQPRQKGVMQTASSSPAPRGWWPGSARAKSRAACRRDRSPGRPPLRRRSNRPPGPKSFRGNRAGSARGAAG